jgi:hypothetical protein
VRPPSSNPVLPKNKTKQQKPSEFRKELKARKD